MPPSGSLGQTPSRTEKGATLKPLRKGAPLWREGLSQGQRARWAALNSFRPLVAVERDAVMGGGGEKRPDITQATARKGPPHPPPSLLARKGKAAQTGKWSASDDRLTGDRQP